MCLLQDISIGSPFVYDGRVFYRGFMTFPRRYGKACYKCLEVVNGKLLFQEQIIPFDVNVKPYEFKKKEFDPLS